MTDPRVRSIKACHMSLFPTMGSLTEAVEMIEAKVPMPANEIFSLLMTYQNTLLNEIQQDMESQHIRQRGKPELRRIK